MTELRRQILNALASRPLDPYQLGADTGAAPFSIRAELQAMRRDRLVTGSFQLSRVEWELTDHGRKTRMRDAQLEMFR